jgi:hypothetical protein
VSGSASRVSRSETTFQPGVHLENADVPQNPIILRLYQEDVTALRGSYARGQRAPLLALPTAGGKTIIAKEESAATEEREQVGGGRPRFIAEHAGNLHELTAERLAALRRMSYRQVLGAKLSERELAAYAARHGYKRGWVWHRLQDQGTAA